MIVDAHLDLSYNAFRGRDVLKAAAEQPADGTEIATVGLPDLRGGGIGLVCATVFCLPSLDGKPGYRTADEAAVEGRKHLAWYAEQERAGHFRFVRRKNDLPVSRQGRRPELAAESVDLQSHREPGGSAPLPCILLLEGADPLRNPDDVKDWVDWGMRIVGLAWKRTRLAGGTGDPGPLTAEGVALVKELDRYNMIHDTSHLAEESFWQLLDQTQGSVIASHSNCRAIVPTDRQLSDEMIRAIVARGGVIGINFFDKFLLPPDQYGKCRATLADVVVHIRHICDIAGSANHVAIGTDMDGGLGRNELPQEIITSADLPKVGEALLSAGFSTQDTKAILSTNWISFFSRSLR